MAATGRRDEADEPAVARALTQSHARQLRAGQLGDGVSAAVWRNADDRVSYEAPAHHTLSLYLAGGLGTYRSDRPTLHGAPERICILPAGAPSSWIVDGDLAFLHVYISPTRFAAAVLEWLDREPRACSLHDALYAEDAVLAALGRRLLALDWDEPALRVAADELLQAMLATLLKRYAAGGAWPLLRGGLATAVRRRVLDYVDSHLDAPLGLCELAAQACLSEFHFARMFRVSTGFAPHAWVLARRLRRARQLLGASQLPLAEVALACGFASQAHFGNVFRRVHGLSPGQWRQAAGAG